jgi:hypothetical protein
VLMLWAAETIFLLPERARRNTYLSTILWWFVRHYHGLRQVWQTRIKDSGERFSEQATDAQCLSNLPS